MVMTIALQELLSLGILFENSIMPHLTNFFFLFFFMCKSPSTILYASTFLAVESLKYRK